MIISMAETTICLSELEIFNDFCKRVGLPLMHPETIIELSENIPKLVEGTTSKKPIKNQKKTSTIPATDQEKTSNKPVLYQDRFKILAKKILSNSKNKAETAAKLAIIEAKLNNCTTKLEARNIIKKLQKTLRNQYLMKRNRIMLPAALSNDEILKKYRKAIDILIKNAKFKNEYLSKLNIYKIETVPNILVKGLNEYGVSISRTTTNKVIKAIQIKRKKRNTKLKYITLCLSVLCIALIFAFKNIEIKSNSNDIVSINESKKTIKPIFYPTLKNWESKNRKISRTEKAKLLEYYKELQAKISDSYQLSENEFFLLISKKLSK